MSRSPSPGASPRLSPRPSPRPSPQSSPRLSPRLSPLLSPLLSPGTPPVSPRSLGPQIYKIIKVLVLGASGVGKTSLTKRLIGEDFDENLKPTVYDVFEKETESEHGDFIFKFTDIGGSRSFPPMVQLEMSKSDICLLVYNVNDMTTLEVVKRFKDDIKMTETQLETEIPFILVGNKVDSKDSEELSPQDSLFADLENDCASHVLTSAKTGINIFNLLKNLCCEGEGFNLGNYGPRMKRQLRAKHFSIKQ